jgi:hypothetical protein
MESAASGPRDGLRVTSVGIDDNPPAEQKGNSTLVRGEMTLSRVKRRIVDFHRL